MQFTETSIPSKADVEATLRVSSSRLKKTVVRHHGHSNTEAQPVLVLALGVEVIVAQERAAPLATNNADLVLRWDISPRSVARNLKVVPTHRTTLA